MYVFEADCRSGTVPLANMNAKYENFYKLALINVIKVIKGAGEFFNVG